jgi:methylmalonyl-CoA mutase N-terminal domain/subunit
MPESKGLKKIKKEREVWEKAHGEEFKGEDPKKFVTDFGAEIKPVYTPEDLEEKGFDYVRDLGFPGGFPYTRGNTALMYRQQLWRIGQYAGFATAQESNVLFRNLIRQGSTELVLAFDLPTQMGYDPDDPFVRGEVGKVGMSLASLRDWEIIFDGIPLDKMYVYSVSNSQAVVTLAMHFILAKRQGAVLKTLRGGMQNDALKEYVARGAYIFPVEAAMRLAADSIIYSAEHVPEYWVTNVCGYHLSEAGGNTVHEGAFMLADALAYLDAVAKVGVPVEKVASKVSFVMCPNHNKFFEEIGKFRACRRLWARLLKERYGVKDPNALIFRVYGHNGGSVLTRQQPVTNITRSAIAAVVGALCGVQNIVLRPMDEYAGIPGEESNVIGIRSQQVVAYETGITKTVDPLGGSYYVEWLTSEYEERMLKEIEKIDSLGGMPKAIQEGYIQKVLMKDAYELQKKIDQGEILKVGLNIFQIPEEKETGARRYYKGNPKAEELRIQELKQLRADRNNQATTKTLEGVKKAAEKPASKENNLMIPIMEAVGAYATMGEICGALRDVFGSYKEPKLL